VDGAHHGPPSVHSVAHSAHDNGCCSCVQSAGRFVHEDHAGVGHQLNSNGQALALLNRQTPLARHANLQVVLQQHQAHQQASALLFAEDHMPRC
jgi:hypothetical protein